MAGLVLQYSYGGQSPASASLGKTRQDKTRQDKTRQDKTRQEPLAIGHFVSPQSPDQAAPLEAV
jgi:hypothetical protein